MLREFEKLTPKRRFISETMCTVDWPSFIHRHSAQDNYVFIVKRLLVDSKRLKGLHPSENSDNISTDLSINTDLKLNIRSYFRSVTMNPNLKIANEYFNGFVTNETKSLAFPLTIGKNTRFVANTQKVAILNNGGAYCVPKELNSSLRAFLISNHMSLPGPKFIEDVENILNHIQNLRENPHLFREQWLSFYEIARIGILNSNQFALILTLLAHHGNNINAILALQAIATNRNEFKDIKAPNVSHFHLNDGLYKPLKISETLENCQKSRRFDEFNYRNHFYTKELDDKSDKIISKDISNLTKIISDAWPCANISLFEHSEHLRHINIYMANEEINALLSKWHENYRLHIFLEHVADKLNSLGAQNSIRYPQIDMPMNVPKVNRSELKYEIDWNYKISKMSLNKFKKIINEAQNVWETGQVDLNKSATQWWTIYKRIASFKSQHLIDAGLFPRLVPTLILPKLLTNETDNRLKMIIGAWAISMANEQRHNRIEAFARHPQLTPDYDREIKNEPHTNWRPCEYPEWLLFEIEQNLTIRRIQIEIAKKMMANDPCDLNTKHFIMQLNMGEGKTAVIVPILASRISNGRQLCQIIVLKSLFATNLKSFRQYLGGMLGRRVYSIPCRRDLDICRNISQIRKIYEECMRNKGKEPKMSSTF